MIGVIGSKEDARSVFAEVRAFLTEALALTVSEEKSGIRKASDGAAFLGYEVRTYTTRQRVVRSRQGSVSFLRRPPSSDAAACPGEGPRVRFCKVMVICRC
jgi:RNA-directed DNA polymerase